MKRKVIKLGTATFVASLPSKWIKQFGLKQGDYLDVEERRGDLVMSTEKDIAKSEKKIDIRGLDTKLASYFLESAYCMGYDRIEILHGPKIRRFNESKSYKSEEFLQSVAHRFIGIEVIEQSEKKTVLKDLGGASGGEADNVLRRIFLLTKWMFAEFLELLEKKNKKGLEAMQSRRNNILRFIYYYRRLLNKKGYKDFNKTAVMFHNTFLIATIVKEIAYVSKRTLEMKKWYNDKNIKAVKMAYEAMEKLDKVFFNYDNKTAMELRESREKTWAHIRAARSGASYDEFRLYSRMIEIVRSISSLVIGRFYLEL